MDGWSPCAGCLLVGRRQGVEWSIHSSVVDSHMPPVQAVFGWMAGKGGLLGEEHSIIDDASQDSVAKWEEKYVAPGGESHPAGEGSGSRILD